MGDWTVQMREVGNKWVFSSELQSFGLDDDGAPPTPLVEFIIFSLLAKMLFYAV